MSYENLIDKIEEIANSHGLVGSFKFGADVYDLNNSENVYPVVYLVPKPINATSAINAYTFTIFIVDKSDSYRSTISNSVRTFKDIFEKLNDEPALSFTYPQLIPFKGEFSDSCDGLYGDLTINVSDNYNRECFIYKN